MNTQLDLKPGRMILLSFFLTIVAGTFLLKLPQASTAEPLSWIDALFLSTSATCVTGLSVVDIGTNLTFFGQIVLLGLIQIGGLGIMTFSVFLMMLLRQNVSLSSILSVNFQSQHNPMNNFLRLLSFVLGMTIVIELAGAVLLFLRFKDLHSMPYAAYSAVFHSVSAFCNAGFSLYPESLVRFQRETFVPFVFMGLIVLGGLGFMLIDELRMWSYRKVRGIPMKMSLHTRVCLTMTGILIAAGAAMIFILEKSNLLEGMSPKEQMVNAFFMSITTRTAGFNLIEIPSLTNATLFLVMWLMFIGGCPGSAAGGVKVTTIAVLFAVIKNNIVGASTSLFHRKIPSSAVIRSLSSFAAGFFGIIIATLLFLMSEHIGVSHLESQKGFLDMLFEITSAFGTVGLSTGITSTLTSLGKFFVVFMMFAGRVGPLTLGVLFLSNKKRASFEYIEEDIVIG